MTDLEGHQRVSIGRHGARPDHIPPGSNGLEMTDNPMVHVDMLGKHEMTVTASLADFLDTLGLSKKKMAFAEAGVIDISRLACTHQRDLNDSIKKIDLTENERAIFMKASMNERAEFSDVKKWLFEISNSDDLDLTEGRFRLNGLKELSGLFFELHTVQYFEKYMLDECAWLELPESIIGLEVGITLGKYQLLPTIPSAGYSNFGLDTVRLGTLCVAFVTFMLQFYVVWCLWIYLPQIKHNAAFCHGKIGRPLQLCSLGVFLVSILPSLKDITLELLVVLTSKKLKRDASETDANKVREATGNPYWKSNDLVHIRKLGGTSWKWTCLCLLIVVLELIIWIMTLVVGCKYLLISDDVSSLIQSMVAIVFVNEVDNLAFAVFVPRNVKKTLSTIEFEVPYLKGPGYGGARKSPRGEVSGKVSRREEHNSSSRQGGETEDDAMNCLSKRNLQKYLYNLTLLGSVPMIVAVAVTVAYGLHGVYC